MRVALRGEGCSAGTSLRWQMEVTSGVKDHATVIQDAVDEFPVGREARVVPEST